MHPDFDLQYKLRNMILSSVEKHRVKNFNQLLKDGKVKHKGNIRWKDFVFQTPGIYEMLGIKRDYFVERLEDIFQNPLLFLFLAGYQIRCLNDWGETYCE